jgi:hypothetical protein
METPIASLFKLKADGGKLTGTMGGDQFEQPIQNGEIHGDGQPFAAKKT